VIWHFYLPVSIEESQWTGELLSLVHGSKVENFGAEIFIV